MKKKQLVISRAFADRCCVGWKSRSGLTQVRHVSVYGSQRLRYNEARLYVTLHTSADSVAL